MTDNESHREQLAKTVDAVHGKSYGLSERLGSVHAILADTSHRTTDLDRAVASCHEIADTFEQLAARLRKAADAQAAED